MEDRIIIKNIIKDINNLKELTNNHDDNYFYNNSEEMIKLLDIVEDINQNLKEVSFDYKNIHKDFDWNIIEKNKDEFGGLRLGFVMNLVRTILPNSEKDLL